LQNWKMVVGHSVGIVPFTHHKTCPKLLMGKKCSYTVIVACRLKNLTFDHP